MNARKTMFPMVAALALTGLFAPTAGAGEARPDTAVEAADGKVVVLKVVVEREQRRVPTLIGITTRLEKAEGVRKVETNYTTGRIRVTYDPEGVNLPRILDGLLADGFQVSRDQPLTTVAHDDVPSDQAIK